MAGFLHHTRLQVKPATASPQGSPSTASTHARQALSSPSCCRGNTKGDSPTASTVARASGSFRPRTKTVFKRKRFQEEAEQSGSNHKGHNSNGQKHGPAPQRDGITWGQSPHKEEFVCSRNNAQTYCTRQNCTNKMLRKKPAKGVYQLLADHLANWGIPDSSPISSLP